MFWKQVLVVWGARICYLDAVDALVVVVVVHRIVWREKDPLVVYHWGAALRWGQTQVNGILRDWLVRILLVYTWQIWGKYHSNHILLPVFQRSTLIVCSTNLMDKPCTAHFALKTSSSTSTFLTLELQTDAEAVTIDHNLTRFHIFSSTTCLKTVLTAFCACKWL